MCVWRCEKEFVKTKYASMQRRTELSALITFLILIINLNSASLQILYHECFTLTTQGRVMRAHCTINTKLVVTEVAVNLLI